MNAKDFWQLFMETGAPEAYLMYSKQLKMETHYVYDNSRHRTTDYRLQ